MTLPVQRRMTAVVALRSKPMSDTPRYRARYEATSTACDVCGFPTFGRFDDHAPKRHPKCEVFLRGDARPPMDAKPIDPPEDD